MPDIPMDILQELFKQSLSSPLQAHQPCEFPWYLGHVCSRWRALFFSMRSTFWYRIEIERHDSGYYGGRARGESAKLIKEIVAFFLDCTCGAPFSFSFCLEDGYTEQDDHIRPIFQDLLVHSEQWDEVSFQLSSTDLGFLCPAKGHLPLLKKLEIIVDYRHTGSTISMVPGSVFEDAPLLTHVVLWDFSAARPFKFNWSSLTIVDFQQLNNCNLKNILAVLRETINLVQLQLTLYNTLTDYPHTIERDVLIHLPRLECLSINNVALLTALETPSLQQLKIDFYNFPQSDLDVAGITAFLRRWGVKLNTLFLEGGGCTATIKEILPLTPKLDDLIFHSIPDIAAVFEWLAGTGTQELRFSNLNVSWTYRMSVDKGLGALHDMIASRNPPGNVRNPSPKEVIIQVPGKSQSVAANLESLCRDKGIRFEFAEEISTSPWGVKLYYW